MEKLKDAALAYVPQQTKNIAELDKINLDVEIYTEEHTKKDSDEKFSIFVIEIDGEKYRVPNSVLEGIQGLIKKIPETKFITVLKTGSGMGTKYQVLPIEEKVTDAAKK